MNFYIIPASLIITVILVFFISLFSKRPMGGLWLFFLIVFLATWSGQLWIHPFGPRALGVSWVPLFIVGLFFSFFILALLPSAPPKTDTVKADDDAPVVITGMFFWIMMMLLVISIAAGYYRSQLLV